MQDVRRQFPSAPTGPRALVITAHPQPDSFGHALAAAWSEGASALQIEQLDVTALDFDPVLRNAYRGPQPLEPDLERARLAVEAAAHLVVAFPVWWSSTPAALKGFFDRLLQPGWAFAYRNGRPVGGLIGRSSRMLVTMDAPLWYDWLVNGAAARRQVATGTLKFCGLAPVRTSAFGSVGTSTGAARDRMLEIARRAGAADAIAVRKRFPAVLTTELQRTSAVEPVRSAP